jgi:hypothetical protein
MGILYVAAVLFWLTSLSLAVFLTGVLLWSATRLWRAGSRTVWPRCLAVALALAAWGPVVWVLLYPPTIRPQ